MSTPVPAEHSPSERPSYWALCAFLLPIVASGFGFLISLGTPPRQDDWVGLSVMIPTIMGLLVGSALSVVAAFMSIFRREPFWPIAMMIGVSAFTFLAWCGIKSVTAHRAYERNLVLDAQRRREEEKRNGRIWGLVENFKVHPELLTEDSFWIAQGTSRQEAEAAVSILLNRHELQLTSAQARYVIAKLPAQASRVFDQVSFATEVLFQIAAEETYATPVRERAMNELMKRDSFPITPELKALVEVKFPRSLPLLIRKGAYTTEEIEERLQRPVLDRFARGSFQSELERLRAKDRSNRLPVPKT